MRTRRSRRLAETALSRWVRSLSLPGLPAGGEPGRPAALAAHGIQHRQGLALTPELGEVVAAWPLGASLAAAAVARGLGAGRRRTALNEALHELRRPLQALALTAPAAGASEGSPAAWAVPMAATALERLEREINGEPAAPVRESIPARPLLGAAVARWRARAGRAGGSLTLRWRGPEATVAGDRCQLAQALDNLIVNAIEHGGPEVVVDARAAAGMLEIAVIDRGRESPVVAPARGVSALPRRLSGRRRHGHGLRVVRRTAAAHGGGFRLRLSAGGAEAVLALALPPAAGGVRR
jgi:signal transduction histidine kinase